MTRNKERRLHIIRNVRYPLIINRVRLNLSLAITFPALNARSSYLYKINTERFTAVIRKQDLSNASTDLRSRKYRRKNGSVIFYSG